MNRWILVLAAGMAVSQAGAAATIEGTVTGPGGAPLGSIEVEARIFNGDWWQYVNSVSTDGTGHYSLGGLTNGDYRVQFQDLGGDYMPEWYDNAIDENSATTIVVGVNATVSNINAQLARGSKIKGKVTGPNGAPLSSIQVEARLYNGNWWEQVAQISTDGSGNYVLGGLANGNYRVQFRDWNEEYIPEWYDNVIDEDSATTLVVSAITTISNVNARLMRGSKITGTVTNSAGTPLDGIEVTAYRNNGSWWESTGSAGYTDMDGHYSVGGLSGGKYRIRFRRWEGDYALEWYKDAYSVEAATSIPVPPLATVSNVNAMLGPAAKITGKITGPGGTPPLEDIDVSVYLWTNGTWEGVSGIYASTDSNGVYAVGGLPAGTYAVKFQDWGGTYAPEWFSNVLNEAQATSIVLAAGATCSNVNATLALAARISGTVTGTNGTTPVASVNVTAYRWNGSDWDYAQGESTDGAGAYAIGGLAAGQYRLQFRDQQGLYQTEWYNNAANRDDASNVVVAAGGSVSNVNASLALGAHIAGTVTELDGTTPIADAYVWAYRQNGADWDWTAYDYTDSAGKYDVGGLPTGSYRIEFWTDDRYATEYYNNKTNWEAADAVVVSTITTVSNVNASLAPALAAAGSRIAGTVTGPGGTPPLQDILVNLYIQTGADWIYDQTVATATNGAYAFQNLAAGTNRIQFMDADGIFATEWYDNSASMTGATRIAVTNFQQVAGINASLAEIPQTGISGTVTESGSGLLLGGITVELWKEDGIAWNYQGEVGTDSSGTYRFTGLLAGSYRIGFSEANGAYLPELYDDASNWNAASNIVVVADQMTTGIDAVLDPILQTGISGTVTEEGSGSNLISIAVTLLQDFGSGWEATYGTTTETDGTYRFTGLSAGIYRLWFGGSAEYISEYFDDAADLDLATGVEVIDGLMTSGIDAVLTRNQPAAPPLIVGLKQKTAGTWEIRFTGGEGGNCILQNSYSLSLTNQWSDFGTPIVGGAGTNVLECQESAPRCFWRVRAQP